MRSTAAALRVAALVATALAAAVGDAHALDQPINGAKLVLRRQGTKPATYFPFLGSAPRLRLSSSLARRLLQEPGSEVPMSRPPSEISSIVVPTDFSPTATKAVEYGAGLAYRLGASLTLLHAVEPLGVALPQALAEAQQIGATESLEGVVKELAARGVKADFAVRMGPAARETIELARERKADLIVIGTHGRSGLSRLLLGSVAENVLRHADCPVLTVRPSGARVE